MTVTILNTSSYFGLRKWISVWIYPYNINGNFYIDMYKWKYINTKFLNLFHYHNISWVMNVISCRRSKSFKHYPSLLKMPVDASLLFTELNFYKYLHTWRLFRWLPWKLHTESIRVWCFLVQIISLYNNIRWCKNFTTSISIFCRNY